LRWSVASSSGSLARIDSIALRIAVPIKLVRFDLPPNALTLRGIVALDISSVHVEVDAPLPGWDVVRLVLRGGGEARVVFRPGTRRGAAMRAAIIARRAVESEDWPVALAELRESPEPSGQRLITGRRGSAYRSKTVSRQTWWQLLEAPGVEPEMRVAAAIGLGPDVLRAERRRVRRLLKRLALPRLRTLVGRGFKSRSPDEAGAVLEQASRL